MLETPRSDGCCFDGCYILIANLDLLYVFEAKNLENTGAFVPIVTVQSASTGQRYVEIVELRPQAWCLRTPSSATAAQAVDFSRCLVEIIGTQTLPFQYQK